MLEVNPGLVDGERPTAAPRVLRARYSALTKDEIERAFSEPRRALLRRSPTPAQTRQRDRPDLGRDPDPRGLARHPPLRRQLPLRRPRPEPDARPDRRARARAPRPRRRAVLGGRSPSSPTPRAPSRRTTRRTSSGRSRRPRPPSPPPTRPARSSELSKRKNTRKPPTPYNTTAFATDASSRLGITPSRAMRIAEDLYMDGFVSYPRTDNTVYPVVAAAQASWSPRW